MKTCAKFEHSCVFLYFNTFFFFFVFFFCAFTAAMFGRFSAILPKSDFFLALFPFHFFSVCLSVKSMLTLPSRALHGPSWMLHLDVHLPLFTDCGVAQGVAPRKRCRAQVCLSWRGPHPTGGGGRSSQPPAFRFPAGQWDQTPPLGSLRRPLPGEGRVSAAGSLQESRPPPACPPSCWSKRASGLPPPTCPTNPHPPPRWPCGGSFIVFVPGGEHPSAPF